ncbi:S8 family serine peptidase [Paenibacillus soyae]|uniref:S8 family serine peptidase n=1 Tax=Paenibacillus soyae TaxID=2969249 RepID=A0A9X2MUY3_9BACL|nr:S8 family serine peptidase [Paenibacillus soyae]MCR2807491.1 S8 family serine peptidase [Paenibacillus soyae]
MNEINGNEVCPKKADVYENLNSKDANRITVIHRIGQTHLSREAAPASAQRRHSPAPSRRGRLRRAAMALLIGSMALATGGYGYAAAPSLAPAPAAEAPVAYADGAPGAEGAASEQPQSWLLGWTDPAQAHELRGVDVIGRQNEAAVWVVRPAAAAGEDVDAWLRRLRGEPGVAYVHPNGKASILSSVGDLSTKQEGDAEEPIQPAERESSAQADTNSRESGVMADSGAKAAEAEPAPKQPAGEAETEQPAGEPAAKVAATATVVKPNDPELAKQGYLERIGAHKAWETLREQKDITIALVDTGIDLDHPDLKDNLVAGVNLVDPKKSPDDDNGHGTSVAGVIAAKGNNGVGVAGILWNAKLMPVKALDEWGDGTEEDLGEGILYAVKNGAKVIVLSVGLHRHSPYMQDIVQYAENKGVVLIAASGNDGVSMGGKAAVKYPAAYPTVLAVGGAGSDGKADARSNAGTELDLIAPWHVYTTAVGGGYHQEEGTSLAAPQAAAAAALILAKHPDFKPYQVRELLRQTAKDVGAAGVDEASGYGMLRLDQAVTASLKKDAREANDSASQAKLFPLGTQMVAELGDGKDQDWYTIDAPYDGTLTIEYGAKLPQGSAAQPIRIAHIVNGKQQRSEVVKLSTKTVSFDVKKGRQHIRLGAGNPSASGALPYVLTSSFTMAPDRYEPNDRTGSAAILEPVSSVVAGSFHQKADRDWYAVTFKQDGKLQLSVRTDTARIDPGLSLQREDGTLTLYDENGEGEDEQSPVLSVTPGTYYIRVHNAISLEASPTLGTYELRLAYTPNLTDPNEPNNQSYEALLMNPKTEYKGVMSADTDTDWFQFRLANESVVSLNVSGVPDGVSLNLQGYDKKMAVVFSKRTGSAGELVTNEQVLPAGVYYVKLTADRAFHSQFYRLKLSAEPLVSGFRDIKGHWAENEIASLSGSGIVNGVGQFRFVPERDVTRAEAVAMIVKAYKPIGGSVFMNAFSDLESEHWAYDAIKKAVQQGWIRGFPDGSFRPDQPVTRAEMAVMIGHAEGIAERARASRPFEDVAPYEWYSPMLTSMKEGGKLKGVTEERYEPENRASRAEFASLLYRYYKT